VSPKKGITLGELAKKLNAELVGNPEVWVKGLNTLAEASQDEISFLSRRQYIKQLDSTKAGAVIIGEKDKDLASGNLIVGKDAYLLYAKATQIFKELNQDPLKKGISELAEISSSAKISSSATVSSFCKISDNVEIGEEVQIGSGVVIGEFTSIGDKTVIHSNVSIYHSVSIGQECIIHAGSVIGSDGLGFAREGQDWVKIEHLGEVIIGNNVEIGSNCSIDNRVNSIGRASLTTFSQIVFSWWSLLPSQNTASARPVLSSRSKSRLTSFVSVIPVIPPYRAKKHCPSYRVLSQH